MKALTLPGDLDSLEPIRDYTTKAAKNAGLPDPAIYRLCLAVDEIATNIVLHGYQEAGLQGNLTIASTIDCGRLIVDLRDTGKPYDPTKHNIPTAETLSLPLEERDIGGLGILFARDGVDDLQYKSTENGDVHWVIINLQNYRPAEPETQSASLSDERRKLSILLSISRT